MATKTVNECGEKKGVYCFNAIVRAHAELMNPGDADWTYRDLRLAGLSAPADVYTSLIRVHGYSGDLTKASKYLSKRDETPNTNTPVSDRPASQFRASRNMHTALIEAYAVNGEVLGAWRAFAEAWKQYGVSLYNSNDKRYMTAIARHYVALEKTPEEIIASLKEVIETTHLVPPKNALMFREHVGLALGEGLLRLSSSELNPPASTTPQALVLSKFPPVDAKKASTLSKAILESLLSPTSPLATQPPPETASAIRKIRLHEPQKPLGIPRKHKPDAPPFTNRQRERSYRPFGSVQGPQPKLGHRVPAHNRSCRRIILTDPRSRFGSISK
ncbi:hypothetical protein BDR26DRAFT_889845, partial [Obelidium mucronatum]